MSFFISHERFPEYFGHCQSSDDGSFTDADGDDVYFGKTERPPREPIYENPLTADELAERHAAELAKPSCGYGDPPARLPETEPDPNPSHRVSGLPVVDPSHLTPVPEPDYILEIVAA